MYEWNSRVTYIIMYTCTKLKLINCMHLNFILSGATGATESCAGNRESRASHTVIVDTRLFTTETICCV